MEARGVTEVLPYDEQAEQSVLGSVLLRPMCIAGVAQLQPEDFHSPVYRAIWRAMLDLWERNVAIDYTTLGHRLQSGDLTSAGVNATALADISLAVPSAAHVEHYAKIVMDTATQRRYIDRAQHIAELAWPVGVDVGELAAQAEALITSARPTESRRDLFDPERWAHAFWTDLEARQSGQRTAVTTGLYDLDAMTLGLEAGGLYLLMGTPGTGKTELAMQIAMHVGAEHGPVLFASLEMSAVELAHRYARISRGMDRNRLAKGTLDDAEMADVAATMNLIAQGKLWPASPSGKYTTGDLRSDAIDVRARSGRPALIVADYVQRFRDGDGKPEHREINVGMVAANLKSLAREFGCPVLAPVQPNREYVTRANKRPMLSDLRESGKLEQEADVVLGLYRDEKHNEDTRDVGIAEVHMLKNRSGVGYADGCIKLKWQQTKYANLART